MGSLWAWRHRLAGRSLDEIIVRVSQKAAAYAERVGVPYATRLPGDDTFLRMLDTELAGSRAPSADVLLQHFRARTTPRFFAAFADRVTTTAEMQCLLGRSGEGALLEHAERLVAGEFDLLGLRGLRFGDPIDWHLEPISGKRNPLVHWSRIQYLNPSVAGDKKITWELNRHAHFSTLGRAYWLTSDERYANAFANQITSWIDANPPKIGINWASSLEVAFRAISWLWALHFFMGSPALTPALHLRMLKMLQAHGRHVESYLSTYFSPEHASHW